MTLPDRREPATGDASPPDGSHRHPPAITIIVVVEVLLAIGLAIWAMSGSSLGWVAPAVLAAVAATLIPGPTGWSPAAGLSRRITFALARMRRDADDLAPAPFDIPSPDSGVSRRPDSAPQPSSVPPHRETERAPIGVRWAGQTLITALRVRAAGPAATFFTPESATTEGVRGQRIPLDVLADCIDPFDIGLASIDVVGHGARTRGGGRAADAYRQTLGPLPATATRTVLVILRLDPRDCPDAVARRGGGTLGALRAATITTRRVQRRLIECGLVADTLSASEITTATRYLVGGHDPGELAEEWERLTTPDKSMQIWAIDPRDLGNVAATIWALPTVATTVTVRLSHTADGLLRIAGLVRFDQSRSPTGIGPTEYLRHLRALPGTQFDALTSGVPMASPARLHRQTPSLSGPAAQDVLGRIELPAGGCGQLVGADPSGRAVAVPLVGPGIETVILAGRFALSAQTVLRTVAIGIPVEIHTARPHQWRPLVDAVADPALLRQASCTYAPSAGTRVEVYDGVDIPPAAPDAACTRFIVTETLNADRPVEPGIVLRQNPEAPQQISVITTRGRLEVTMVATPQEWAMTGERPPVAPTVC